jgi:putative nucleotidyltransferase with HDIG domain
MMKRLEETDQYTFGHSVRVQEYTLKIAKELRLSKVRYENLFYSSLLHDIGKINVPIDLLNKKEILTTQEMEMIKKHALYGSEIVNETFSLYIGEIILQHHERIDGSGYPFGLKGNQILLEAKIIAVADTYDAMTSQRVYREAVTPHEAIVIIKQQNERQYSKPIVDAFERILKQDGVLQGEEQEKVPS